MSKANWMTTAGGLLIAAALVVGCKRGADGPAASTVTNDDGQVGHDHPTEGLHGGTPIELGDEEYHAELVHDEETGTVTIHILDAHAELAVPIDATELTINLKRDGQAEQLKLAAPPTEGDAPGKSSRFVSKRRSCAAVTISCGRGAGVRRSGGPRRNVHRFGLESS